MLALSFGYDLWHQVASPTTALFMRIQCAAIDPSWQQLHWDVSLTCWVHSTELKSSEVRKNIHLSARFELGCSLMFLSLLWYYGSSSFRGFWLTMDPRWVSLARESNETPSVSVTFTVFTSVFETSRLRQQPRCRFHAKPSGECEPGRKNVGHDLKQRNLKEGQSRCSGNGPVYSRRKSLTSHKLDVTSVTTLARIDKADNLGLHTYR